MIYYPDFLNLAQVSAIYSTFKNCDKKMGSPCLSSHCVLVIVMSVFFFSECKTQIKKGGSPFSFHRKLTKKRDNFGFNHFARLDWGEFQDKHPFSRVELSKSH